MPAGTEELTAPEQSTGVNSDGVDTPVSPGELGLSVSTGAVLPYAIHRTAHAYLSHKNRTDSSWLKSNPAPSAEGALRSFLLPTLPGLAVGGALSMARPLFDPAYRNGERGFLSSWLEGHKNDADALGQKAQEAKRRYGAIMGAPVQALHGLMNPVASLIHGGGAVKDYFTGKQGALRVAHADKMIQRAITLHKS